MRRTILLILLLFPMLGLCQSIRIVWIGDSITDGGWGRSGGSMAPAEERNDRDQNHCYGHSYMFLCASALQSDHPERGYSCFNRGISGYTLQELHTRWKQDIEALQPDVISILIGTNDVHRFLRHADAGSTFDLIAWEQSYREYLRRTREALPEVHLILCTPFVMQAGRLAATPDYPQRAATIAACAECIRHLADEFQAELVDFHALFSQLEQQQAVPAEYWIWDGIHPTPAAHHRMARMWLHQTKRQLRKLSRESRQ